MNIMKRVLLFDNSHLLFSAIIRIEFKKDLSSLLEARRTYTEPRSPVTITNTDPNPPTNKMPHQWLLYQHSFERAAESHRAARQGKQLQHQIDQLQDRIRNAQQIIEQTQQSRQRLGAQPQFQAQEEQIESEIREMDSHILQLRLSRLRTIRGAGARLLEVQQPPVRDAGPVLVDASGPHSRPEYDSPSYHAGLCLSPPPHAVTAYTANAPVQPAMGGAPPRRKTKQE